MFFCVCLWFLFVCLFYVKQVLLMQIPCLSTLSFIPPHMWVLNQMEAFGMKTGSAKPSPVPSLSRADLPTKSTGSQLLWSNSQLSHEDRVFMVEVFDCSKFYRALRFNMRKLVYIPLEATVANKSNINNKADIFVSHFPSSFVLFFFQLV